MTHSRYVQAYPGDLIPVQKRLGDCMRTEMLTHTRERERDNTSACMLMNTRLRATAESYPWQRAAIEEE